jgi:hypothetical protein
MSERKRRKPVQPYEALEEEGVVVVVKEYALAHPEL